MDFPRNLFIEYANSEGHSAQYLEDTLNYVDYLNSKHLPVIFSLKHFAILLGIEFHEMESIIIHRNHHYSYYLMKKRRGGCRRIISPHSNIKALQKWIKVNILDKVEASIHATGFVKNKSILDNAKTHVGSEVILNLDLSDFFETIQERRVYGIFKSLGYSPNLSVDFAKICTAKISEYRYEELDDDEKKDFKSLYDLGEEVLVQGAPTSPTISNLVCRKLDYRLAHLANKLGVNYSRYADDITFSGAESGIPKVSLLKRIIEDEGFKINWEKVKKHRRGQKQMVTGLSVNEKVRVPKKFKKEIYRHLHFCKRYGPIAHFNRISPGKGYRKEWLLGKIFFINSIEPDVAKKMLQLVNQINWEI